MAHTAPQNTPYSVSDIDFETDGISVAIAYDNTVEFQIEDTTNMGAVKYSSMTPDQAVDFAYAIISAAEDLRDIIGAE